MVHRFSARRGCHGHGGDAGIGHGGDVGKELYGGGGGALQAYLGSTKIATKHNRRL